uniref:Protein CASC3 n=1 Tax=Rhabditophanes sp. KR3021 TaxID=114890 RepID=A0AC35TQB3_9BILA
MSVHNTSQNPLTLPTVQKVEESIIGKSDTITKDTETITKDTETITKDTDTTIKITDSLIKDGDTNIESNGNDKSKDEVPIDPTNDSSSISLNENNNKREVIQSPTYIPRNGKYYMHDDRAEAQVENSKKKATRSDGEWKHDKFFEAKQMPKSKGGLIKKYGGDIRGKEDEEAIGGGPVKGRGKTVYATKETLEMDEVVAVAEKVKALRIKKPRAKKAPVAKIEKEVLDDPKPQKNTEQVKLNTKKELPHKVFQPERRAPFKKTQQQPSTEQPRKVDHDNKNNNEERYAPPKRRPMTQDKSLPNTHSFELGEHVITKPIRNGGTSRHANPRQQQSGNEEHNNNDEQQQFIPQQNVYERIYDDGDGYNRYQQRGGGFSGRALRAGFRGSRGGNSMRARNPAFPQRFRGGPEEYTQPQMPRFASPARFPINRGRGGRPPSNIYHQPTPPVYFNVPRQNLHNNGGRAKKILSISRPETYEQEYTN